MPTSSGLARSRIAILTALIGIVGAVVAASVVYLRVSGEERPVISQTTRYVEGVTGTWQRVNPLFAGGNPVDQDLSQLVFSGLVRIGDGGEVLPDLAESLPQISEGGRTYTFRLREGVRWHDGQPFTSEDVVFTIETILASGFRGDTSLAALWDSIAVSAPDERTVVFRLPEPSAPFLARNATIGILPSHLLSELSAERLFESPFNFGPIGTGPYRLESLTAEEARLQAYSAYHLGRPAIGEVRMRFYPDYTAAVSALQSGDIEGLMFRSATGEAHAEALGGMSGLRVLEPQRSAYVVLYLNNDAAAFFQDERVRKAIALMVDREAITEQVYDGAATPSSSPVAPGSWAYDEEFELPPSDALEAAAELLDDAGWEPHPTTGIRIRLGSEFRITIRTDTDPARVAAAQMIAQQLEPLGIRATVASTSFAVLRRDFLQERRYEAAVAGWDQGADPDPYFGWHSSQMGSAGLNIANYSDPVADRLIEEGRRSSHRETREDMYRQFQEIWDRTAPSIIIAYPQYTYAQSDRIEGHVPGFLPAAHLRFSFIHEWRRS